MTLTSGSKGQAGAELVIFNGVSGVDGNYPFPRTTVRDLAALANGKRLERPFLEKLRGWLAELLNSERGPDRTPRAEFVEQRTLHARAAPRRNPEQTLRDEFNPSDLGSAGWGVIFPRDSDPRIREALRPLLEWRRTQAAALEEKRFREFSEEGGYTAGESMCDFFCRHDVEFGAVDPDQLPYHLLIVGGPHEIPFSFQYDLDVRYAVGRLDFDRPQEYAAYAESVVAAERADNGFFTKTERCMTFFCPANSDYSSLRIREELVGGLVSRFSAVRQPGWGVQSVLDDDATQESLCNLLAGVAKPDILFTACHGLIFPPGHALQRAKQGALFCKNRYGKTPLDSSVSAGEISDQARVHGLITFQFACHSAGTPEFQSEGFASKRVVREAPRPFTARLPQRLLGHPNGGALAVIGNVSRVWTYSFTGFGKPPHLNTFEDVLRRILRGETVGRALELLNLRYAQLAAELLSLRELERLEPTDGARDEKVAILYCAAKDARSYVLLGDPAVRIRPAAASRIHEANSQAV